MDIPLPGRLAMFCLALTLATAARADPEDMKHLPLSITLHPGEVLRYRNVDMAASSDSKVAWIGVKKGVLTIRAIEPGTSMLFVFPPSAAGAEALQSGAKKRITVNVVH